MTSQNANVDVAVVGAGPSALLSALAIADHGWSTALIGPVAQGRNDLRTTALFEPSLAMLTRLGVKEVFIDGCTPLKRLALVDMTNRQPRAPEITFSPDDLGRAIFGRNVDNAGLCDAMMAAIRERALAVTVIDALADDLRQTPDAARVTWRTADAAGAGTKAGESSRSGALDAKLVVAADGKGSVVRNAAGISVRRWAYPQMAVAGSLRHARPHGHVSTELHHAAGPLVLVPKPGNTSSFVWVETPDRAQQLSHCSDHAFAAAFETASAGLLGTIEHVETRGTFKVEGVLARRFVRGRVALVGESGHAMPPIGAQGLNLSFRDVAALLEAIGRRSPARPDVDPGAARSLADYDAHRRSDAGLRAMGVDVLNRSVFSGWPALDAGRSLALQVLRSSKWARARLMRQAISPWDPLPPLMRVPGL